MLTPHLRVAPRSRLETLRRLSLFADLSDAELRLADSLMCEIDVAPGTAFIKQRQVGREAFVITSGTAEVTIDGVPVARLGPGDLVGETALLTDASRSATVTALTP
ncbi:MAG: family transcriptional regulator, cyclic receptor protein, partial [Pseudonocardiales bacterium]|nr:family transcriptional regulator, cyclic receptor protein [Pseudonocardiales bacterium]